MEKNFNHHRLNQNFAVIIARAHTEEKKALIILRKFVVFAEVNILQIDTTKQNSVQFVGIKSIKKIGKANVYNMEVKSHHNFSVCGGFIVHNCLDSTRYMCSTIIGRKAARFREIRR